MLGRLLLGTASTDERVPVLEGPTPVVAVTGRLFEVPSEIDDLSVAGPSHEVFGPWVGIADLVDDTERLSVGAYALAARLSPPRRTARATDHGIFGRCSASPLIFADGFETGDISAG
jgi:hypothetical protein